MIFCLGSRWASCTGQSRTICELRRHSRCFNLSRMIFSTLTRRFAIALGPWLKWHPVNLLLLGNQVGTTLWIFSGPMLQEWMRILYFEQILLLCQTSPKQLSHRTSIEEHIDVLYRWGRDEMLFKRKEGFWTRSGHKSPCVCLGVLNFVAEKFAKEPQLCSRVVDHVATLVTQSCK